MPYADEKRSNANSAGILMAQYAMFFAEADHDRDGVISLEDFRLNLPVHVREQAEPATILQWFEMLAEGKGPLRIITFFIWSLKAAALSSGAGGMRMVQMIFAQYDRDKSGSLTELEFNDLVRDLGLTDHAEELWAAMPGTADGNMSYAELVALAVRKSEEAKQAKIFSEFIVQMAWNTRKDNQGSPTHRSRSQRRSVSNTRFQLQDWTFTAADASGIQRGVGQLLKEKQMKLTELLELFDADNDNRLSRAEFARGMIEK